MREQVAENLFFRSLLGAVKFLLDMNVPRALGAMLASAGHNWRHVADTGMARASDAAIIAEAKSHEECVVTHDLDYGALLAFSGDSSPSILIFRMRRVEPDSMYRRIMDSWHEIEESLNRGAIVVIEESATRIRRLPVARSD